MLARLILVLLLAAFAVPAAATSWCQESAPAHHAMPGMPDAPDNKAVAAHVCIGCIPPGDWLGAPVLTPKVVRELPVVATIARFDVGLSAPPALPPPRAA